MLAAQLSQVCAYLGDNQRAAALYRLMLPHAKRNVVPGALFDYLGSVSHYLGLLAATMEHWDDAVRHFGDALVMNEKMGARP